ncbi:hypothetical protein [Amycolatopsis sp. H20-H5]|uniref:hypothetical protein n=1 Tax=Amycolatopsis sp. H20-H5 TaxID=3046309 RepID=UPI002DBB7CD8|nr:hypothetical protein [Amycolatopsis sp. H20-H5]MEC3980871.1 hypothetical protein [Amycolatopsis sp. H20-H5]
MRLIVYEHFTRFLSMSVPGDEPIGPLRLSEMSPAVRAARQRDYSRRFPSIAETLWRVRAERDEIVVPGVDASARH